MPATKTTTTVEYPIDEFNALIKDKLFKGKDVTIYYVIQEVGGDYLDRYPGTKEVTKVKITYDGNPLN
jgi:hypothetical protein